MYTKFATWADVLTHAKVGWLHYHAPLDLRPTSVRVVRIYKNGKLRLDPGMRADPFTADESHLDRFRHMVG